MLHSSENWGDQDKAAVLFMEMEILFLASWETPCCACLFPEEGALLAGLLLKDINSIMEALPLWSPENQITS